jgi:hypothetical protein
MAHLRVLHQADGGREAVVKTARECVAGFLEFAAPVALLEAAPVFPIRPKSLTAPRRTLGYARAGPKRWCDARSPAKQVDQDTPVRRILFVALALLVLGSKIGSILLGEYENRVEFAATLHVALEARVRPAGEEILSWFASRSNM